MNERQAAHFLWVWSRRRQRGLLGTALLGLAVGVGGGLAFALLFWFLAGVGGDNVSVDRSALAPFFAWVLDTFGPFGMILSMAAPLFGALGGSTAYGLYGRQERQYQALIDAGHRVPEAAPVLTLKDWGPTIVLLGVAGVVVIFVLVMAYLEVAPG